MTPFLTEATVERLVELSELGNLEHLATLGIVADHPDPEELLAETARCLYDSRGTLAAFGVWPMWRGVGRAWSMLSARVLADYPISLHRNVRGGLEDYIQKFQPHRVEAIVRFGHEAGDRWIRQLGFGAEGTLRKYDTHGNDCIIYSRCPKWT